MPLQPWSDACVVEAAFLILPLVILWVQYPRRTLDLTQIFLAMVFAKDPSSLCEGHVQVLRSLVKSPVIILPDG